jgi:hypothetical protein
MEAAGQAAPIDGHDEAHGGALLGRGVVVGAADVVLDLLVDQTLGRGHLDEAVFHLAGCDQGLELAGLLVAAQQLAGVSRDQGAQRGVQFHQTDRRLALRGFELLERNGCGVAQGTQDLADLEATQARQVAHRILFGEGPIGRLGGLEQVRHAAKLGMRWIRRGGVLEEVQEGTQVPVGG